MFQVTHRRFYNKDKKSKHRLNLTKLLEDKLANLKDTMPKDEPHLKPLMDKRKLKRHQFNNQIASLIYWQVLGQGEICLDPVRVTLKQAFFSPIFAKLKKFSKLKDFPPRIRIFHLNSREIPNYPHKNERIFLLNSRISLLNSRFRKFCCTCCRKIGEKKA